MTPTNLRGFSPDKHLRASKSNNLPFHSPTKWHKHGPQQGSNGIHDHQCQTCQPWRICQIFKPRALSERTTSEIPGGRKKRKTRKIPWNQRELQKIRPQICISPENVAEVVRFIGFRDPFLQVSLTSFPLCNSLNVTLSHQEFVAQSLWCTQATKYAQHFQHP